jgi:(+)-trans-carveol dehydrogenase
MSRMAGKVAFVTGAARGQGRSHCITLAREGAKIVGLDICHDVENVQYPLATAEDLEETKRLIKEVGGDSVLVQGDVREPAEVAAAVEAGLAAFGHIDTVVCNAGVWVFGSATEQSLHAWKDTIDLNLTGAWNTVQAVLPSMLARDAGGSIMFTASQMATCGSPNASAYAASKAGLVGLMRSLAHELGHRRIRVNSIHPSTVDTPMVQNQWMYDLIAPPGKGAGDAHDLENAMAPMHILPVPLLPAQAVSDAVLFLASDESAHITSVALPVDAGSTQKLG